MRGLAPVSRVTAADKKIAFNRELRKKSESLDSAAVAKFVRAAHGDLKTVKEMLAEEPGFINATRDWGGGDFESGLGGASHMGNREMALFLIENGARPNIFTFAMLGELAIVKAMLTALPQLLHTPGPHGIPLINHAKKVAAKLKALSASWNRLEADGLSLDMRYDFRQPQPTTPSLREISSIAAARYGR